MTGKVAKIVGKGNIKEYTACPWYIELINNKHLDPFCINIFDIKLIAVNNIRCYA